MRILIIGCIAFAVWATVSTYIYVCEIKGLCLEPQTTLVAEVIPDILISEEPVIAEKVAIPEDLAIYFSFDKSDFVPGAKFDEYLDASKKILNNDEKSMLKITGHTDAVGSIEYNQALGLRRAQAMHRYLVSRDIPATRISMESKGEMEPVADNKSVDGRAKNRRSVLTIKQ